ncbi:MAG: nitroreductase family protein [Proteobacteria bacterium]|nr:nitroreductase family protein [Pseudomonadota bacterium]
MDQEFLEQVDHILSTARSVRRRLDFSREVSREDLEACINIAVQAPTGIAGESWRFLVVTDPGLKLQIAEIYNDQLRNLSLDRGLTLKSSHESLMARLHEIPCMVLVFYLGEPDESVAGQVAFFGSVLPAAWSLMLAMRARGIGTTWTSLLTARSAEIAELLGVPEGVTQTVMLPAGYCLNANLKPAARLNASEVTYWNGWGRTEP